MSAGRSSGAPRAFGRARRPRGDKVECLWQANGILRLALISSLQRASTSRR
jgi:hypothetical protein